MKKRILASLMAIIMLAALPADAIFASEAGSLAEIIWSDTDGLDAAVSVSANSADMLDDDDMFVDADSSEEETDMAEEETDASEEETDSSVSNSGSSSTGANAADMLDDDDIFVDAGTSETETDASEDENDSTSDEITSEDGTAADTDASEESETEAAVSTTVSGTCGADSSNLTWTLVDGVLTISGSGEMATYAVNTTSVTDSTTNPPWFGYNDTITSVVIESGVTSIGAYAFMHCTSLTSISIPNTVTSIGARAFYECTALTSIAIPDSVTSISSYAFLYCSSLKSVTLSSNLTAITMCMFAGCSSLTSITIPEKVTSIAMSAFANCSLTSITIPASVTTISEWALSDCYTLTSITVASGNTVYSSKDGVLFNKAQTELILYPMAKTGSSYTIPTGVTTIADGAFCSCLFTSVTIPDTVTTIGEYAFDSCTGLTGVTIPDSVTSVGTCAFYGCTSLKNAVIGSGVTSIETYAFEHCTALTSVTIPAGVTSIGEWAFYKCTSLATVYYQGTKTAWASVTVESGNDPLSSATVYYGIAACTITLSQSSYTYDGTAKKPAVTVKDGSTTLTAGTDYTVSGYSNNKKPGTATVTLTGKGDYSGSTASVNFTINKISQSLTVSTSASAITVGSKATITASGTGTITYSSSDKTIAKVSSKGVVTGKKAGTVTITVTAAGNSTTASATKTIKIKVKLATCSISSLTNTARGITVKWKKVTGADGYYVKRKTSDGSYKVVATITSGSTLKYVDTDVKSKYGTTYVYKIVAYSGTSTGSGTAKKTVRLKKPTISTVTNNASGSMIVTWSKVSKGTGYQIQYSTSSSFASSKTVWVKSRTQVSQTIAGLTGGNTYYVRIRTYYKNSAGTKYYSAWSSAKSVTIQK
ncbi:MAG: leucine-rich repeat protein [Clostridiales bacterium]|nr:leucine-rich repeat protein [Clostridiales bacterium]